MKTTTQDHKTHIPFDTAREEARVLERCDALVDAALKAGADEAEAYGTRAETIAVRFEKGDLKLTQVDDGATTGLRVFREARLGFAATNQGDPAALEATARDAVLLSKSAPPHTANVLPATRALAPHAPLWHASIDALGVDEVVDLGASILSRVRARDPRISIDNASCEWTRVSHAVRTSNGTRASESDALLSLGVFGMAIDGEDVGGFHYGGDALRTADAIEPALSAMLEEFTSVALGNLNAGRAESYKGPVLFAPDAVLELFVAPLVSAASAIAVQRGRSALAQKLQQRIAFEGFDLTDDPTDRELAGAGAFDREGQPAVRFPIVAHGVLQSFLYNGYAAAVEGRTSTGHARGGPRSVPGLGPHALVLAPGRGGSRADLERTLGRGLFVQRFSGSVDPASGDFSGVAKSARWIENGVVVRSLKETLLSGNAFDLLQRILALSSASERCSGSARAPYALVDGVSVTAG
ncbi:MAG: TldD/PmbA family protein [Planctomycetes bacterium]|nr:TldD/PmbA family protein [Planctomycetota bacterium]